MIISHRHKFIFVHLGRTGGRSLTTALAASCGPEDVITPTGPACPARNAYGFRRHYSAQQIRAKVGEAIWNDYFKFTIERNPWDKILSQYWGYAGYKDKRLYKRIWEHVVGEPLSFPAWFRLKVWQGRLIGLGHIRFPAHYRHYAENGQVLLDFIGRYENRQAHLALLSERLGIPIDPDVRTGVNFHKERRPYPELFDAWMCRIVENAYRDDLRFLGYRFGEPPPRDALLFSGGQGLCRAA